MEAIKDTVQNVMGVLKAKKEKGPGVDPQALLKKNLTKQEMRHIKFHYFKNGILSLKADSSSWLYHLNLRKETLARGLKKELANLKDIRLRLGG